MTSVITGDIIRSQGTSNTQTWQLILLEAFKKLEINKTDHNIYRGDSFQIEIKDVAKALESAIYIKACIKTINHLDVRMAIGIGDKTYEGKNVSFSIGSAFVYSGETLEKLKNERLNLKIKTSDNRLDEELNLYLKLVLMAMDSWTTNSAEVIKIYFENPDLTQKDIAKKLNITQNAVSKRQSRANLDEVLAVIQMYKSKLKSLR